MSPPEKRCEESPGPIIAEEEIAYGLYSPEIFDPQTGLLTPEAIKIDDLRGPAGGHVNKCGDSTGISVSRLSGPDTLAELKAVLAQITSRRPARRSEGHAIAQVGQIWRIRGAPADPQPLNVLDDGRPDYRSHAVIRAAGVLGRSALRGPKHDLIALLNAGIVRER
jgi:hypothetical protein